MSIRRPFSISGTGVYLPKTSVPSSVIEKELDLPPGLIHQRMGVASRYKATAGESNTFMGARALETALADAQLSIADLDCLVSAAATFDYIIPNRSCLIKHALEDTHDLTFPCVDINTVCTSFITALDYASMLLNTGDYQHVAIVSSESSSNGLNPHNVETYGLFGDGAAAIIVSRTNQSGGLLAYASRSYVKGARYTIIEGGGNAHHPKDTPYDSSLYSFNMQGLKLLRTIRPILHEFWLDFFGDLNITPQEVDLIVPHQASKNGLKMLAALHKGDSDNVVDQLESHGNCIAASIPIALANSIKANKLKEGDTCFLVGTGAGLTISGLLFKYTKL